VVSTFSMEFDLQVGSEGEMLKVSAKNWMKT
jgi:hypothetical protein